MGASQTSAIIAARACARGFHEDRRAILETPSVESEASMFGEGGDDTTAWEFRDHAVWFVVYECGKRNIRRFDLARKCRMRVKMMTKRQGRKAKWCGIKEVVPSAKRAEGS